MRRPNSRLALAWVATAIAFTVMGLAAMTTVAAGVDFGVGGLLPTSSTSTSTSTSSTLPGTPPTTWPATIADVVAGLSPAPTTTTTTTIPEEPTTTTTVADGGPGDDGAGTDSGDVTVAPVGGGTSERASVAGTARGAMPATGGGQAAATSRAGVVTDFVAPAASRVNTTRALPTRRSIVLIDELAEPAPVSTRRGERSTAAIFESLAALDLPATTLARLMAPFPLAGVASYTDDGRARTLLAVSDRTPVVASSDGAITIVGDDLLELTTASGSYFVYGNLASVAPALRTGDEVARGDIIGFVGGGDDLYFEVHPNGGLAVNPVPYLDRWLTDATDAADAVRGAPNGATALSLRRGAAKSRSAGDAAAGGGAAGTATLGAVQPISATALGPAGLLATLSVGWYAWHRAGKTRRRSRPRR